MKPTRSRTLLSDLRQLIAEVFSEEKIVSALRRELSWTHFGEIIHL